MILLIRHAWAGKHDAWHGDDRRRPLDERGREQAHHLVTALAHFPLKRVLTSPYDRCMQTVEPMAAARGLAIESREELGEGRQETDGAALVRSLDGDVAVCCHGGLSERLVGRKLKKGAAFALARERDRLAVVVEIPAP